MKKSPSTPGCRVGAGFRDQPFGFAQDKRSEIRGQGADYQTPHL